MQIFEAAPDDGPSLALHGGAGSRVEELTLEDRAAYSDGLQAAYRAGWQVLAAGGSALDAVCASVEALENNPLFNAGRGAALTATGQAELDASVMTGTGRAGAVARDTLGRVAAATSTGGMVGQADGRVGDSPIVGAGVYARDNVVAISGTGHGEAFIRGVVAYDIAARIRYAHADLATAVRETIEAELGQRGSTGGVIAVGGDGRIVVAHNSPAMFSARGTGPEPTITT